MDVTYLVVIIAYILLILGVSFWRSRGVKDQEDFMVAGRSAPAWLLVGSLIATWIGAGSLIGGGGRACREGFSQLWMSGGAWLGILVIYFLADRVRRISQYTVQDLLEKRYHPSARVLGSIVVVVGSLIIFSYQLLYGAFVLEYLMNLPQIWGILATAALIVIFTMMAGLRSILAMDIVNGTLIIVAIFVGLPLMLSMLGGGDIGAGMQHVATNLPEQHFSWFGAKDFIWAMGVFFPTFFLLLGESSIYQKFYSAKDGRAARKAVVGFMIGVVVVEVALAAFSVASSSHENTLPWRNSYEQFVEAVEDGRPAAELDEKWTTLVSTVVVAESERGARPEDNAAALDTASRLYRNRTDSINLFAALQLPVWAGALFLAAGMAIIFSTGNSFMMAASTAFTRDIWQRFLRPRCSQKEVIWIQRLTMIGLAALAVMVLTWFTTVWEMALTAYSIIGAGLTPVILAAFLWKRVTPAGGVASIAAALLTWAVVVGLTLSGVIDFELDYVIYPTAAASIIALILFSLLTKPSSPEVVRPFMSRRETDE